MTAQGDPAATADLDGATTADLDGAAFEAVATWVRTWFIDGDRDRMTVDGLSIGWALHVEAFEAVLAAVLPALGRPQRVVGRPFLRRLRRAGLDRPLRSWAMRLLAPRGASTDAADVVLVSELATPSALGPAIAVGRALRSASAPDHDGRRRTALALVADPRALRAWRPSGVAATPLVVGVVAEARMLAAARRSIEPAWQRARALVPPLLVGDRDLTTVGLASLEPLVSRSAPWLFVERAALEAALDRARPRAVVLTSDQHRIGRLACAAAAARGVPSIVLQHGLPQSTLGYLPVVADRVLVWSPSAADWFVARGTPRDRLAAVGNARIDELVRRDAAADRRATDEALGLAGHFNVLVGLSVASPEVNVGLVDAAMGAVGRIEGAALVVKLHPGGSDWTPVRTRVSAEPELAGRVRILEREPLNPLLGWADAVVVHRSTVAVEALVAGRPVAAVRAGGGSAAALDLAALDLPEVDDAIGLTGILEGWASPAARAAFLDARRAALEWYVGPLDGRAADRAAGIITDMAAAGRPSRGP